MSSIAAATLAAAMEQAVADGLNDVAKLAQKGARELAPKDTEGLAESIKVDEASPRNLESAVRSNARHAVPQHERLDYRHPNGGQAKYLEAAVEEVRGRLEPTIAAHVRRTFG